MDSSLQERLRSTVSGFASRAIAVYVFGSLARGTDREDSDIDLGVLLREMPAEPLARLGQDIAAELTQELGREVDVVILNEAPADLVHRVLRDGILLLESDRSARIAFEVAARNRYFDLKPILDEYRGTRRSA
ncbi:MAG: nucleotidyltransferase domain-containing protein [Nannocystaceae bacterium]